MTGPDFEPAVRISLTRIYDESLKASTIASQVQITQQIQGTELGEIKARLSKVEAMRWLMTTLQILTMIAAAMVAMRTAIS